MKLRAGINGFGRIGRNILRALHEAERQDLEIVAINDLGPVATNAHLLRYDSVHGKFPGEVTVSGDTINLGDGPIKVFAERDPSKLPWEKIGVDIVLECTGRFTTRDAAATHLAGGAKRVLVSAPATGADLTVVYGINHQLLTSKHVVVSNASCTTNCLAPLAKLMNDRIGINKGIMTTIHSFTGDQPSLDTLHKDLYRGRAASLSIIPTSTGAARAVGLVLPELAGKLDGISCRVPTPNVSLVDFKFTTNRQCDIAEINAIFTEAAAGPLHGILSVTDAPLVSSDCNHDAHSAVVALDQTKVVADDMVMVVAWYDNEWGFSNRMIDTAVAMGRLL